MSGSRSVESLDLSSFSSLWAVECGLMVSRFVELARERLDGEARVEDLLVLLVETRTYRCWKLLGDVD